MTTKYFAIFFQNGEHICVMECDDIRTLYYNALLDVRTFGTYARIYNRQTQRLMIDLGNVMQSVGGNDLCELVHYWMGR